MGAWKSLTRQEGLSCLLPKISSALAQLVRPIGATTSNEMLSVRQRKERAFKRSQAEDFPKKDESARKEEPPPGKPDLKLVSAPAPAQPKPSVSVAHAFIQLFTVLQQRKTILMRWLGAKAYQSSAHGKKGVARFKKGAMIDKRVG
jgi:hypothetical protein